MRQCAAASWSRIANQHGGAHTGVGARCAGHELAERDDFDGAEFARWGFGLVVFMFVFPRMLAVMFS